MALLIIGVLLFAVLHLIKGVKPDLRDGLAKRFGENRYKGLFSLALVLSIVIIVFGWQATDVELVYEPPAWGHPVTSLLVLVAFIFFAAANMKSNIKRTIRHPMLTGVVLWGIGHLLSNGENRSVALFGGLIIWALVEIVVINRRDGAYEVPEPISMYQELKPIIGGCVVYAVFIFLHPYLFGVSPLPG